MNDPDWLISKYFYDTLDEEESAALNTWICQDPSNASHFVREAIVHRTLRAEWVGSEIYRQFLKSEGAENQTVAMADGSAHRNQILKSDSLGPVSRRMIGYRSGMIAVMVLCLMTLISWKMFSSDDSNLPREDGRVAARLHDALNASWDSTEAAPEMGPLASGPRTLKSGKISLAFGGGAAAIIEGPATFEPVSSTQLRLSSGRVVISCPTLESRGFELLLPSARIVDLGTEFGVIAGADAAEVHVFQGAIAIRPTAVGAPFESIYRQQHACRLSFTSGQIQSIPVNAGVFSTPLDFRLARLKSPWADYARKLRQDRDLVLWMDMTPGPTGLLTNNASQLNSAVQIVPATAGYRTQPGRQSGSVALEVLDAQQAVRLRIPGLFKKLTLAAWVKFLPERQTPREHRGILMSDGWGEPGQIHWQRKAKDFRLTFPRQDAADHARYIAETNQLDDDQWHLLVTVVDGQRQRRVIQYLDGRVLSNDALNIPVNAMQLGACTLGGWQPPKGNRENRSLNGLVDELLIWKRALNSRDVEELYRASR